MVRSRSPWGKEMAKLRIELDLLSKDTADVLGISVSRQTNVEFGDRSVPEAWPETLAQKLDLNLIQRQDLIKAYYKSKKDFKITPQNDVEREFLVAFEIGRNKLLENPELANEISQRILKTD